jgi:hypothetical protein
MTHYKMCQKNMYHLILKFQACADVANEQPLQPNLLP